jgi:hypothetical protein
MLQVYHCVPDTRYELAVLKGADNDEFARLYPRSFEGASMASSWKQWRTVPYKGQYLRGDFMRFSPGMLVCEEAVAAALGPLFATCAELLPMHYRSRTVYGVNVTKFVDALDEPSIEWLTSEGIRHGIKTYAFRPEALDGVSLFKVPLLKARILVVSGMQDPALDFKRRYEEAHYQGLTFELLWTARPDA